MTKNQDLGVQPIELGPSGHYTLPEGLRFQCLIDPREGGIEAARIRLTLGTSIVLDLPVSQEMLTTLSHSAEVLRQQLAQHSSSHRELP